MHTDRVRSFFSLIIMIHLGCQRLWIWNQSKWKWVKLKQTNKKKKSDVCPFSWCVVIILKSTLCLLDYRFFFFVIYCLPLSIRSCHLFCYFIIKACFCLMVWPVGLMQFQFDLHFIHKPLFLGLSFFCWWFSGTTLMTLGQHVHWEYGTV